MKRRLEIDEVFRPQAVPKIGATFVGRELELDTLSRVANQDGGHVVLYGQRGIGKTTIAQQFRARHETDGHCFVTVTCTPQQPYGSFIQEISVAAKKSLALVAEPPKTEISLNVGIAAAKHAFDLGRKPSVVDIESVDSVARHLATLGNGCRTTIIVDEFDVLVDNGADSIKRRLPFLLKRCSDAYDEANISFVIVGLGFNVNDILGTHPSLARNITELRVQRLTPNRVKGFFEIGFGLLDILAEDDAIDYLTACSAGYPYTMHLLGQFVCFEARRQRKSTIDQNVIRRAFGKAKREYHRKNIFIYRDLSEFDVETMLRMCYVWKDGVDSEVIVKQTLHKHDVSVGEISNTFNKLCSMGVIKKIKDAEIYYFDDPYTRVKIMIDHEFKRMNDNEFYPKLRDINQLALDV